MTAPRLGVYVDYVDPFWQAKIPQYGYQGIADRYLLPCADTGQATFCLLRVMYLSSFAEGTFTAFEQAVMSMTGRFDETMVYLAPQNLSLGGVTLFERFRRLYDIGCSFAWDKSIGYVGWFREMMDCLKGFQYMEPYWDAKATRDWRYPVIVASDLWVARKDDANWRKPSPDMPEVIELYHEIFTPEGLKAWNERCIADGHSACIPANLPIENGVRLEELV